MVAAPLAAWLVRLIPARILGSLVGGLIVFTNVRTILTSAEASDSVVSGSLVAISLLWAAAVGWSLKEHRRTVAADKAAAPADEPREPALVGE